MSKEPKTMQELHKIREEHYERVKGMPLKEVMKQISAEAQAVMKKYGLKLRYNTPK